MDILFLVKCNILNVFAIRSFRNFGIRHGLAYPLFSIKMEGFFLGKILYENLH